MNSEDLRSALLETLSTIVPGIDWQTVDHETDLRDQIDIDSMDMLNWVIALHQRLGVDIPEVDVPRLATLDGAVRYLADKVGLSSPA
jgi:acyl carrier protein